jgi:uncharacterized protein YkwD
VSGLLAALTLLLIAAGSLLMPGPARAGVASTVEARILELINHARENRGREPLELRPSLGDFAGDRAEKLASTGVLKHPDCLPCMLDRRGISYSTYGETIAWSYPWGPEAARRIFRIWKNSPPHWGILMSRNYDRIGIGVARRGDDKTYAAAVLTG